MNKPPIIVLIIISVLLGAIGGIYYTQSQDQKIEDDLLKIIDESIESLNSQQKTINSLNDSMSDYEILVELYGNHIINLSNENAELYKNITYWQDKYKRKGGGGTRTIDVPINSIEENDSQIDRDILKEIYTYGDGENLIEENDQFKILRGYFWKEDLTKGMVGRLQMKGDYDNNSANWSGARLGIINPENLLERYEIRFYPILDKIQINYVDRTNRTGNWAIDQNTTISQKIISIPYNVQNNREYYVTVVKKGEKWDIEIMDLVSPTLFISFSDDRIQSERFYLGLQSAGRDVESKFNTIFGY